MGVLDILKKTKNRLKKGIVSTEKAEPEIGFEEEFSEEPGFGLEEPAEFETLPPTPTPIQEPLPEEVERIEPKVEIDTIKQDLELIKSKLEQLESHLKNIESQEVYQKGDIQNYLQYLTFINDKIDQLEQEHAELERLMKERVKSL